MSSQLTQLQDATIKQYCKTLRMPMMASQFNPLAEQAVREKKTHTGYLEALLTAEVEERERNTVDRRIKDAHLPRVKTLEEFDYTQAPMVTAAKMHEFSQGGYIERVLGPDGICSPSVRHVSGLKIGPASIQVVYAGADLLVLSFLRGAVYHCLNVVWAPSPTTTDARTHSSITSS